MIKIKDIYDISEFIKNIIHKKFDRSSNNYLDFLLNENFIFPNWILPEIEVYKDTYLNEDPMGAPEGEKHMINDLIEKNNIIENSDSIQNLIIEISSFINEKMFQNHSSNHNLIDYQGHYIRNCNDDNCIFSNGFSKNSGNFDLIKTREELFINNESILPKLSFSFNGIYLFSNYYSQYFSNYKIFDLFETIELIKDHKYSKKRNFKKFI